MPFITLSAIEEKEPVPGFHGRFVHSENNTCAYWRIEEGATLPEHAHPHEQVTTVTEGQLSLTVGGETRVLDAGTVAVIPGGVPHSGRAGTNCRVVDIFYPVREEYR
ncbi:MAG: cupin domain-containing protein [Anaerolineales bacterium]|nr:cupin domain-containing protein [Anaerolineales bacterium]